jgi:signal transduction histidine kinase
VKIASVRLRLALWNVAVLALVLVVFAVSLRYLYEARLMSGMDREMLHATRRFAGMWSRTRGLRPFPPGPPPGADERGRGERRGGDQGPEPWRRGGMSALPGDPIRLPPRFLDPAGLPMPGPFAEGPWDPRTVPLAARGQEVFSTTVAMDRPVRVLSVAVVQDGRVVGIVQLAHALTDVYNELGRLTRTLLTVVPLALIAAALGGAFLTDRALRPVRRITQAAATIGASDLSDRLPVKGRDEFAELSSTFNGMLGRLEQAFGQREQALHQLEAALDQQRRFTADASHELRTPLTIIKARTSLALEGERSGREYRQALEAADQAADTTIRIVQDLLLLARGDAGELRLERRPVPIGELLDRAAAGFRGPAAPSLSIQLSDPDLMVSADPHHMLRLFTNLLENAVRHTPATGSILISAWDDSFADDVEAAPLRTTTAPADRGVTTSVLPVKGVVVQIRDTGEGIPPEHLPHVCERFYRVDAARSRRQGGSGLGLAICRSIVAAHGGTLTIESVLGQGTTVTVRLPRPSTPPEDTPDSLPDETLAAGPGIGPHGA